MRMWRAVEIATLGFSALLGGCTNEGKVVAGYPVLLTSASAECVLADFEQRSKSTDFRYSVSQSLYPLMEYSEVVGVAEVEKESIGPLGFLDVMADVQKECYADRALSTTARSLRAMISDEITFPTSEPLRAVIDGDRITIFYRDEHAVAKDKVDTSGI